MTCLSCGGMVAGIKDFSDYGPTMVEKCLNCGRTPEEGPGREVSFGPGEIRGRHEVESVYGKVHGKNPKKRESPKGLNELWDFVSIR